MISCLPTACAIGENAGSRSVSVDSLQNTTWEWTQTTTPGQRIEVSEPHQYTIRFKGDGEARIRYDCNHGGAMYEAVDGRLSFSPLTFTRIKCGEGSYSIAYRRQLEVVTSFFTEKGRLYLELPGDSGVMQFRPARDD